MTAGGMPAERRYIFMVQQIINGVVPVAITALVAVLVAGVKALGDAGVNFFNEKAAAVRAKAGADKWNHWMALARQAWDMVDEEFRITPTLEKTMAAKQAEFAVRIEKLIPGITDEQIDQLRQAVAGEVNKGRAAVEAAAGDADGDIPAGAASAQPETGAAAAGSKGAA